MAKCYVLKCLSLGILRCHNIIQTLKIDKNLSLRDAYNIHSTINSKSISLCCFQLSRLTRLFVLRRTQEINNKYLPPKGKISAKVFEMRAQHFSRCVSQSHYYKVTMDGGIYHDTQYYAQCDTCLKRNPGTIVATSLLKIYIKHQIQYGI